MKEINEFDLDHKIGDLKLNVAYILRGTLPSLRQVNKTLLNSVEVSGCELVFRTVSGSKLVVYENSGGENGKKI